MMAKGTTFLSQKDENAVRELLSSLKETGVMNQKMCTWQKAVVACEICRVLGIFEKWKFAAEWWKGPSAQTYRAAYNQAVASNPRYPEWLKRVETAIQA